MPIYSMAHYIMVEESTSNNGLKYLMPHLGSIMVVGKMEASNLYKTFLNFLL